MKKPFLFAGGIFLFVVTGLLAQTAMTQPELYFHNNFKTVKFPHEKHAYTLRGHNLSFSEETAIDGDMSPWVFDPHSGGTPVPEKVREETRARILAATQRRELKNISRVEVRFQGVFCYLDAYEKGSAVPTHLCRLRYSSGRNPDSWSAAFYSYAHERYEPCVFPSGKWLGTPEDGLEVGAVYLS
ncbi:MAG: hypothetical protein AABZ02_03110 [Bacteroidota bacterium]